MSAVDKSPVGVKAEEGVADTSLGSSLGRVLTPRHRSARFCTVAESFPTKEAFFKQTRRRLLDECGYEARPSKKKPTKISVRCERYHADGCPFRLCAFLEDVDGDNAAAWRISEENCTWQHSHELALSLRSAEQTPQAPRSAASLATSSAKRTRAHEHESEPEPPRIAVVYTGSERFASADAFIARTRQLSLERYGITCWVIYRTADSVQVGCSLRGTSRCGYRVTARRRGDDFVVDFSGCRWQHSHERGRTSVIEPGTSLRRSHAQQQRRRPVEEGSEEADRDEVAEDEERSQDGAGDAESVHSEDGADAPSGADIKVVPPAAPKVGDRFDTLDDAYTAFAIASILHLGKSVSRGYHSKRSGILYCIQPRTLPACPFRAVVGRSEDSTGTVVLGASVLHHNHAPRPEVVADPSWRPPIRCKLVLAALAKLETPSPKSDLLPPLVPKRARLLEPVRWSTASQATPLQAQPPEQSAQARSLSRAMLAGSRSSAPSSLPTVSAAFTSESGFGGGGSGGSGGVNARVLPVLTSSSGEYYDMNHGPPPEDKPLFRSQSVAERVESDPRAKSALVSTFLAGLDLVLVPLAPHLVSEGVDSLDSVTALVCMSPGPRRALLEDLHQRIVVRTPECPSPVSLLRFLP